MQKTEKSLKKWSDEFLNVLHTVHKVHTTTLYILFKKVAVVYSLGFPYHGNIETNFMVEFLLF